MVSRCEFVNTIVTASSLTTPPRPGPGILSFVLPPFSLCSLSLGSGDSRRVDKDVSFGAELRSVILSTLTSMGPCIHHHQLQKEVSIAKVERSTNLWLDIFRRSLSKMTVADSALGHMTSHPWAFV